MKVCRECNIEKDVTEFYKSKSNRDGFRFECKDCFRKDISSYPIGEVDKIRKEIVNRKLINMEEKICKYCFLSRPLIDFPKCSTGKDGHTQRCNLCKNIYLRNRRIDNLDYRLKAKEAIEKAMLAHQQILSAELREEYNKRILIIPFPYHLLESEEVPTERKCSYCQETKPIEEFYKDSSRPSGISYVCKDCGYIESKKSKARKKLREKRDEYDEYY